MTTRYRWVARITVALAALHSLGGCAATNDSSGEAYDEDTDEVEEGATVVRSRFERDVDQVIAAMGEKGVGCAPYQNRDACAASEKGSTTLKTVAVRVGDTFEREAPLSLCYEDTSGALSSCISVPPAKYDCPIGWDTCQCYDFWDCLDMVYWGECIEGTFWCGPDKCYCEASS